MKCLRCNKEIGKGEVHIFYGGRERKETVEMALNVKVSLCGKPLVPIEPVLCEECRQFLFEYEDQISCPLCGRKR